MRNKKVLEAKQAAKKAAADKKAAKAAAKSAPREPSEPEVFEGSFPRGGSRTPQDAAPQEDTAEQKDFLFATANKTQSRSKSTERKRKTEGDGEEQRKRPKKEKPPKVERLSFARLSIGTAMLGAVKEARNTGLTVSLPNQLSGFVRYDQVRWQWWFATATHRLRCRSQTPWLRWWSEASTRMVSSCLISPPCSVRGL